MNSNESKIIEELYLTFQIIILVILLNFYFPLFAKTESGFMKIYSISYGTYIFIKFSYFVYKHYFLDKEDYTPLRILAIVDGLFVGGFILIQQKNGLNFYDLFYIYLIIQVIRYQYFKTIIFSCWVGILHFTLLLIENHTKTLEFEFIISIITYFVINYIIAFTLKEMNQLRSEKHYYYEQVQKKNNELEKISVTDYLTTLNNYQSFYNYFNKVKTKSVKYKDQMCLTLIDIDNFKKINDTYGHIAGDQVLREISRILKTSIRETDFVARYGGEEFAIVFPNTELKEAIIVSERIRKNVEIYGFQIGNKKIQVTISLGTDALHPIKNEEDEFNFIKKVDGLLYLAKESGKNQVRYIAK